MEKSEDEIVSKNTNNTYLTTSSTLEELKNTFPYYNELLSAFNEGKATAELRKKYMLKMIDEVWVRAIEDTLPSLDVIIRNPGVLLQENEEILPIELTRKITGRSVEHLSQHTDLINEIKNDGTVIPSKLLNILQDETFLTYENKFINTLINRLYAFVLIRYDGAIECGEDEKNTTLTIKQEFEKNEVRGKISLSIEVSEKPKEHEIEKNYVFISDLWKRVEKIKKILTQYMASSFCQKLGKNFLRPPIMRTNKIRKNVDFRQCLSLWEFLENYENTGYETVVKEDLENISESCINDLYNSILAQYVLFQQHIDNEFVEENMLDSRTTEHVKPVIKEVLDPLTVDEFKYDLSVPSAPNPELVPTELEDQIDFAVRVALAADCFFAAEEEDENEESVIEDGSVLYRYRYSFLARLIRAQGVTQDYYTQIKNELLSYKKVKSKTSWNHEMFMFGKNKCARINVKGKTIFLYLPLDPKKYPESKYHHFDVSEANGTKDIPFLLKVRSDRAVKYAIELIGFVMEMYGLSKDENAKFVDYHLPYETSEQLANRKPPLAKRINGCGFDEAEEQPEEQNNEVSEETVDSSGDINYRYRFSFMARLIQSPVETQDNYGEIKNEILSYKKVKSKISWNYEMFKQAANKIAKINIKGKTIFLYLPLNPSEYDINKYHQIDLSNNSVYEDTPFLLKVRSDRSVKYAKELIGFVMAKYEIDRDDNAKIIDYHYEYMTAEELVSHRPPYAKKIEEKSSPFDKQNRDINKDEQIDESDEISSKIEQTDEQFVEPVIMVDDENAIEEIIVEPQNNELGNDKTLIEIPKDTQQIDEVSIEPEEIIDTENKPSTEQETVEQIEIEQTEEQNESSSYIQNESDDNESDDGEEDENDDSSSSSYQSAYKYRYSYTARLVQATDTVKEFYSEMKNYILSFNKVKSKISWGYEAFRFGTTTFMKWKVRGKSIVMYLMLNPRDLEEKYFAKDLTKKDGTIPELQTLVKVKSERFVKFAKELFDKVMTQFDTEQNEVLDIDYKLPYKSTEDLLAASLVKNI